MSTLISRLMRPTRSKLFEQVAQGDVDCVKKWLRGGGDVDEVDMGIAMAPSIKTRDPAYYAERNYRADRHPGWSLLHYAAVAHHSKMLDLLLENGASFERVAPQSNHKWKVPLSPLGAWAVGLHAAAPWFNRDDSASFMRHLVDAGARLNAQEEGVVLESLRRMGFGEDFMTVLTDHTADQIAHFTPEIVDPQARSRRL